MAGRSGQLACDRGSGLGSIIRLLITKVGRPGGRLARKRRSGAPTGRGHQNEIESQRCSWFERPLNDAHRLMRRRGGFERFDRLPLRCRLPAPRTCGAGGRRSVGRAAGSPRGGRHTDEKPVCGDAPAPGCEGGRTPWRDGELGASPRPSHECAGSRRFCGLDVANRVEPSARQGPQATNWYPRELPNP
jgi:hypothetical protein